MMFDYLGALAADIRDHWHIYITMPFIAAAIGYLTKLVAVEMMFRPLTFRGIGPLGWQGVIPRFAPRMAVTAVDLMLSRLVTPQELMERVDLDELLDSAEGQLLAMTDELSRELLAKYYPTLYESMPEAGRRLLISRIQAQTPRLIAKMFDDLRDDVDQVLDLRTMAVDALIRDKALLVRLIRQIGRHELAFIVRSGLLFGFLLGIAQVFIWAATHEAWLMPVFGFFVGYSTDWIALNLVFRPIKPRRFFGLIRWQGMFHRRRAEVTVDYANLIAAEIISPRNVAQALLTGPQSDRLFALVEHEITHSVDDQMGVFKPLIVMSMGGRKYQEMKQDAVSIVFERFPATMSQLEDKAVQTIDVNSLVVEKMHQMTDEEYEGLLRPAFKQDEWKLVLIGGVLGAIIGELQVLLLLH